MGERLFLGGLELMGNIEMEAELTIAVGSGLVQKGETFTIEDEERARLYEQAGMAKKAKKKEPERTQDVQTEEAPQKRGRPPKTRQTKADSTEE